MRKYRIQKRKYSTNAIEFSDDNGRHWQVYMMIGQSFKKADGDKIIQSLFEQICYEYQSEEEEMVVNLVNRAAGRKILLPFMSEMIMQARLSNLSNQQLYTPGNLVFLLKRAYETFKNYGVVTWSK